MYYYTVRGLIFFAIYFLSLKLVYLNKNKLVYTDINDEYKVGFNKTFTIVQQFDGVLVIFSKVYNVYGIITVLKYDVKPLPGVRVIDATLSMEEEDKGKDFELIEEVSEVESKKAKIYQAVGITTKSGVTTKNLYATAEFPDKFNTVTMFFSSSLSRFDINRYIMNRIVKSIKLKTK